MTTPIKVTPKLTAAKIIEAAERIGWIRHERRGKPK